MALEYIDVDSSKGLKIPFFVGLDGGVFSPNLTLLLADPLDLVGVFLSLFGVLEGVNNWLEMSRILILEGVLGEDNALEAIVFLEA